MKKKLEEVLAEIEESEDLCDFTKKVVSQALQVVTRIMESQQPGVPSPFICGVGGEKDKFGLPEYLFVCPIYGLDGSAMYKKFKEYDAPGW
jgi:hypothetical protein